MFCAEPFARYDGRYLFDRLFIAQESRA